MNTLTMFKQLIMAPAAVDVVLARNKSGGTVAEGAVVILDQTYTTASEVCFTTTTGADDKRVLGMAMASIANGAVGKILKGGFTAKLKVNGTVDIAVGDLLSTYTSAGIAAKATAGKGGAFAMALEAYTNNDSSGVIDAYLYGSAARVDTDVSGVTLDAAYNGGVAITVDAGAVALSNTAADNNGVLSLTKNPAGAQSGSALAIVVGAQATGAAISITNTGSGNDISGTTAIWTISKTGAAVLGTLSSTAHTLLEGTAPAGTLAYIVRDNDGDVYVNAITGKVVTLRINGTDVITAAGAVITLAQATTISAGGLTVTGNAVFNNNVTITGTFSFGGQIAANAGIDMNGSTLILDADGNTDIRASTNDQIDFRTNAAIVMSITATTIDLQGNELVLDADANTSITADTDNQIDFRIAGADDFQMTANTFTVLSGSSLVVAGAATVNDDVLLGIGTSADARLSWDTTDANANELLLQLPAGDATNVPVLIIGQAIESFDFGLYNGVVDPRIAIFSTGAVTTAPVLEFRKSRGTVAVPTVITAGDDLGSINVYGYSGAGGYVQAAAIEFDSIATVATTRVPGVIRLRTATDAAPSVLTTAITISPAQLVTCAAGLTVTTGALTVTAGDLVMTAGDIDLSAAVTGTYDLILKDAVADALSIRRAATDVIVFDTATPLVTITPATTITGLITGSAGITLGSNQNITVAGAADLIVAAATAAALEVYDSTTKLLALDTRIAVSGATSFIFAAPAAQTLPNGAIAWHRLMGLAAYTVTLQGVTQVTTAMDGMVLHLGAPTVNQAGGAVTVDKASAVYITAIVQGASVTITDKRMIDTSVAGCYLTNAGVWTDASSREEKEDIQNVDKARIPGLLRQVKARSFRRKDPSDGGFERFGLIAEEAPDFLRSLSRDGVAPGNVAGFALAAVMYLQEKVEALEAALATR